MNIHFGLGQGQDITRWTKGPNNANLSDVLRNVGGNVVTVVPTGYAGPEISDALIITQRSI